MRGVAVNPNIIKTMLERNWVKVVGHARRAGAAGAAGHDEGVPRLLRPAQPRRAAAARRAEGDGRHQPAARSGEGLRGGSAMGPSGAGGGTVPAKAARSGDVLRENGEGGRPSLRQPTAPQCRRCSMGKRPRRRPSSPRVSQTMRNPALKEPSRVEAAEPSSSALVPTGRTADSARRAASMTTRMRRRRCDDEPAGRSARARAELVAAPR